MDLDQRIDGMAMGDGSKLTTGNLSLKGEDPDIIDGYKLFWDGEMRLPLDIFRDLGFALLLSLTAIYLFFSWILLFLYDTCYCNGRNTFRLYRRISGALDNR